MSRSLRLAAATAVATCLAASSAGAFQPVSSSARPITALSAAQRNSNANDEEDVSSLLGGVRGIAAAFALFAMTTLSGPAGAVSGGGLDYANLDITGQDFSNEAKTYKGKDFSVSLEGNFTGHICTLLLFICIHLTNNDTLSSIPLTASYSQRHEFRQIQPPGLSLLQGIFGKR